MVFSIRILVVLLRAIEMCWAVLEGGFRYNVSLSLFVTRCVVLEGNLVKTKNKCFEGRDIIGV